MQAATATLVYRYASGLYVNLTNRCPTACSFCIKRAWKMDYRGYGLALPKEPSAVELAAAAAAEWAKKPFSELVFCGFGEPTMNLEALKGLASALRAGRAGAPADLAVRLNTNGLGSLVAGRDIVPELKGLVDAVNVSLNTADPAQWLELMNPAPEYRAGGFEAAVDFARKAAASLPRVTVTAVEDPRVDMGRREKLAGGLGAAFRVRPRLEEEGA